MTQQYDNTNKGALFSNKDRDSDSKPNAKGSINIEGVEYWLSAWTNTDKNGNKYQKLSVQAKEQAHNNGMQQANNAQQAPPIDDLDSDIPF
jgi:hypothetical protein